MKKVHKLSSWQVIALGYLLVILTGSFLLALPVSSKSGEWTPYINTLFTATSATCVTGLIAYDTYTHWSIFGQIVILLMIQTGGIGFMTVITLFALILKRNISLYERKILMQSAGNVRMSGIIKLVKRLLYGTLIFEGLGAVMLASRFIPEFGFARGMYYAVFHSVSAFCNAGFDLFGFMGEFSSLMPFRDDVVVNLTIMFLIFIGGIGFIVWNDFIENKFNFKAYNLHTRIVVIASLSLIAVSTALFFAFERDGTLKDMPFGEALLCSAFQAVTTRTAGFNTIDQAALSDSSILLTYVLMFIGGSSGSTAGGIKITTFVVIVFGIVATIRNRESVYVGKRRLEIGLLFQALTIFVTYLIAVICGAMIICVAEPNTVTLKTVLYEVISAIGTVGLSMGITPSLHVISKLVLAFLMYTGRVGVLTIAMAVAENKKNPPINRPVEKILIG